MDSIQTEIRRYFAQGRGLALGRRPSAGWPDEDDFYRFLTDSMQGAELERMLEHLKTQEEDRRFVAAVREMLAGMAEAEGEKVPAALLDRVRAAAPKPAGSLACPHCRRVITPFKKPLASQKVLNALWLAAGAAFFGISFFVPRYFIQWTVLGALCILKWIIDSKQTKTQVLVYKALSEASEAKGRHLHPSDTHL